MYVEIFERNFVKFLVKKPGVHPMHHIFTSQYAKYPALILSKNLFIEFAQRHVAKFFRQQQPATHILDSSLWK